MNSISQQITTIWNLIKEIPDPEIPVINIAELGMLREVKVDDSGKVEVLISPTYTGCPAMRVIEEDITAILKSKGYTDFKITSIISPAWTTDLITEEAREKLRVYGIAPPQHSTASKKEMLGIAQNVACPQCKSTNTKMISQFGSTACKALYKCNDCLEPFDYFKCL